MNLLSVTILDVRKPTKESIQKTLVYALKEGYEGIEIEGRVYTKKDMIEKELDLAA